MTNPEPIFEEGILPQSHEELILTRNRQLQEKLRIKEQLRATKHAEPAERPERDQESGASSSTGAERKECVEKRDGRVKRSNSGSIPSSFLSQASPPSPSSSLLLLSTPLPQPALLLPLTSRSNSLPGASMAPKQTADGQQVTHSSQSTRVLRSQSKELSKRSSIPPSEAGRNSTKNQTSTQALHGSVVPLPASAPGRPYEPKDLTQLVDDLARSYSRLSLFQRHAQRIFWLTVPALFGVLRYFRKNLKHVVWRVLCILFWVLGITAVLILLTHISLAVSFVKKLMTLLWRTLAFWNWLDDFLDAVSNPSSIPNVLTSALYQVKNLTMQSIFDASDFFSGSLSSLWNSANHTLTWFTTLAVPLAWSSASWRSPIVTFNVSQNMSETLSFYGQTAYQGLMLHDAPDHLYKARRCMMELGELAARAQTEFVKEEIFQKGEAWLREEQKSRRTVRHFFNENILGVNLVIMSSDFALRALNEIERSYNQSSSFINMFRGGRRDEEILEVLQRYVEQVKTRTETLLSFAVTTNLALENLQQNLSVITYAAIHEEVKTSNRLKSIQRKWNRKFVPWTSSPEQDLADQLALIEKIVQAPRAAQMHLGFLIRNLEATHDRIERLAGFLAVNITRDYFTRENSAQMIGVISHGAAELRQTSEIGAQMRQRGQQREVAGYN